MMDACKIFGSYTRPSFYEMFRQTFSGILPMCPIPRIAGHIGICPRNFHLSRWARNSCHNINMIPDNATASANTYHREETA